MGDQLRKCNMKFIGFLLVSMLLVSCARGQLANRMNIQVEITSSKDRLINSVTNDESFKNLSENIIAEIQDRLLKSGIMSSAVEIKTGEKNILLIEHEYLESDSIPVFLFIKRPVYVMKGKLKLIDPKTQKVLLNESFDETEDKLSDFVNSVSGKISKKVIRYFN